MSVNKLLCSHRSSHLCVFVLQHQCLLYLSWRQSATLFSSLFYSFALYCCIHLSLRAWQGAITLSSCSLLFLSSVFCTVLFSPSLPLSLSLPIVGRCSPPSPSFLPHPPAPSLLFCSLCARSVSWALTSRCDPTELR